jgi:exopolysaccharide production protein ExoZ
MNRLLGLELLRGIAALLVLLEHVRYSVWFSCGTQAELPWLVGHFVGYWGVDIFFVLSGYLIGLTLDRPGTTARSFFLARLARIVPLYAVTTAVSLAVLAVQSKGLTPAVVVTTFTLLPIAGNALYPRTVHPYGWTLCYEMVFYLAGTALAARLGGRRAVLPLLGLFLVAPLALAATGPVPGWEFPSFAFCPITVEFALGLAAYRMTAAVPKAVAVALLTAGVAGFVHGEFVETYYGYHNEIIADPSMAWERVSLFGLPAFACVLGTARLDLNGTFALVVRLATAAGAVSYSLYLVQPIAFAVTALLATLVGIGSPSGVSVLTVAVTLPLAAALSRYIDHPLHALARGWAKRLSAPRQVKLPSNATTFASIKSLTTR